MADGEVADFGLERARRSGDNTTVTVAGLLALVAEDIPTIEGKAVRAVIIVEFERDDGNHLVTYRCGCKKRDEIALLTIHLHRQCDEYYGE